MKSTAQGDAHVLGSLRSVDGKGAVRMEDRFDTDIENLWSALSDPGRLQRWLGEVDGELRVGGHFRAHFFASGWEGTGRVQACEPTRYFLVITAEDEASDEHSVSATLRADGAQSVLVFEERGMPLEQVAAYGAGVQVHVEDLGPHLTGRGRCDAQARMTELMPAYQQLETSIG